MSNKRFGLKEVADVTFYKLDEHGRPGSPVICLDTLKVSNIEQTAEQADAKGGKGNASLISWDHSKEINVILQDAMLSEKTLEMTYGKGSDGTITISANTFPGCYYVEGMTYTRDMETGKDEILKLFIPRAKIISENTITMEAEGDPTVFDMKLKALRGTNGEMMRLAMEASEADGLKFTKLRDDWGYEVTGGAFTSRDLIIPSSYNGERVSQINDFSGRRFETVTIPDTVIQINDGAFGGCSNLTLINLPSALEEIRPYTFAECSSLRSIIIPKNVGDIEANAFEGCLALEEIKVDKNNESYMDIDGALFATNMFNIPVEILKYPAGKVGHCSLPETVNIIGAACFEEAYYLPSISFPITRDMTIGKRAFKDCVSLTAVNIPHQSAIVNTQAFVGCTSLRAVSIPLGSEVSSNAFTGCDNLRRIYVNAPAGTIVGSPWGSSASVYWGVETDSEGIVYSQSAEEPAVYDIVGEVFAGEHLVIPETYNNNSVNAILTQAFRGCGSLKSVHIPSTITRMEQLCFVQCPFLTAFSVDENNPNYSAIDGILFDKKEYGKKLLIFPEGKGPNCIIPEGTTTIDTYAFYQNQSLTSVTIPNSCKGVNGSSFVGCSSLTTFVVSENNQNFSTIDGVLFNKDKTTLQIYPRERSGAYSIPNNVTTINSYAFSTCDGLTSVTIPESVTSILLDAFAKCAQLKSVIFHEGITKIGVEAFENCKSLTSINLPQSLTTIGAGAFANTGLTSVDIPGGVVELSESLLQGCSSLTSVNIGEGVKTIGGLAFKDCINLPSITIPESVTAIASNAFENCDSLIIITINKEEDSISGKPWGAKNATIHWAGGES